MPRVVSVNTYNVSRGRREQTTHSNFVNIFKNVNILDVGDDIQIYHEKCIEESTNISVIT